MDAESSRWTNLTETECPECFAPPGDEHVQGCRTGNRDIAQDTPDVRRTIAKVGANAKARAEAGKVIRELETALAGQGYPKGAVKRAIEDLSISENQRAKWDTAYAIVRSAMGIPLQLDAFHEE